MPEARLENWSVFYTFVAENFGMFFLVASECIYYDHSNANTDIYLVDAVLHALTTETVAKHDTQDTQTGTDTAAP